MNSPAKFTASTRTLAVPRLRYAPQDSSQQRAPCLWRVLILLALWIGICLPLLNVSATAQLQSSPSPSNSLQAQQLTAIAPLRSAPSLSQRQSLPPLSTTALLTEVQKRAVRFFWDKSDPQTGLTNDRAHNLGGEDDYTVASIASTGYALASLPIAARHGWIEKEKAYGRALQTLRFLNTRMLNEHGWFFHFVDKRTGERVWNCELSTIDTCLLLEGALMAGQYWRGSEVEKLANALYARVDWQWMRTNGNTQPNKKLVAMGWKPETGFLRSDWDHYCELMLLYLLGMGTPDNPLPPESWREWERNQVTYGKRTTLASGPIFLHEMAQAFYNFRGKRDVLGYSYWVSSEQAVQINRQYCLDLANAGKRRGYAADIWGLNACDGPDGYKAYGALPSEEDGTVSPTGAIAAILFAPDLAKSAADAMYARYGDKIWGRYGFSNGFNADRNWYDQDVIGIDLGMALLAIEDVQTGLPWKLLASHPATQRALKAAGFHPSSDNTHLRLLPKVEHTPAD